MNDKFHDGKLVGGKVRVTREIDCSSAKLSAISVETDFFLLIFNVNSQVKEDKEKREII